MTTVDAVWTVAQLRDLVAGLQPAYSVYLGVQKTDASVDFATDLGRRWHAHAATLARQGAADADRDAVTSFLNWLEPRPTQQAVFAMDGRVHAAGSLPDGVPFDLVRWGAPATVTPVLAWLQRHPAYLVVLVDHLGADVTAVPAGATAGSTESITGPDDQTDRIKVGGWSAARYARRSEDSWQHNAAAAAEAVRAAAESVDARLLLVGGETHTIRLLTEHLPETLLRRAPIRQVPGGRSADGSASVRRDAITAALVANAEETNRSLLERFAAAQDGTSVSGADRTVSALLERRVETLFVTDRPDDTRRAWFGPDVLCAARRDTVPAGAGTDLREGSLVDVAVRAALLADAQVRVLEVDAATSLPEQIGAICRYR